MDISQLYQFLFYDFLGKDIWLWALFLTFVVTALFVDLGIFNKKDHVINVKESLKLSLAYIAIGLAFGLWVYFKNGADSAADYYTVYLLEKALSLDNLFVMSVIFASFRVPREYQHRILVWGIIGVILLRGIMIGLGAAVVHEYEIVLLGFAGLLIVTGIRMMFINEDESEDYSQKGYVKFLARYLRVTDKTHGNRFFVKTPGAAGNDSHVWHATPLLLALCTIELTDVMFALDSVPAALAITTDTYVVYTANIFAILGLRALFFAMEHVLHRFEYLKYSLSVVLIMIGGKVFYGWFFDTKIPAAVSLGITLLVLAVGVIISMLRTRGQKE